MSLKYSLGCLILLISRFSLAENGLIDPVTKKETTYYITYFKTKAHKLNPFEDLEVQVPVINNNQLCTDKIRAYMTSLTTDESFRARFKDHAQQAIANFINSKSAGYFSEYDLKVIRDQDVVMASVEVKVLYYYNNLLCIQIEPGYLINHNSRIEMTQCIYVNLITGNISRLSDLCPKKYQANFINYLTAEKNKAIAEIHARNDNKQGAEEEEDGDEDSRGTNSNNKDHEEEDNAYLKEKTDLSDIVFDVNAMNFPVVKNSFNTFYTIGKPYIIYASEDSIYKYLPWTLNPHKAKFSTKLNPENVNKNLLIYERDFFFLQDESMRRYFEMQKDKKEITVYRRQNFSGDTIFKKNERMTYNSDNTISEIATDFNGTDEKPGAIKKYSYTSGKLKRMEYQKNNKPAESVNYFYNSAGYLTQFTKEAGKDSREEHHYTYEDLSVNECITEESGNKCHTYLFDSLGNYLSRYRQGEKPPYLRVFSGNTLMAIGDMLYSYNADGQVESIERDRGRHYTTYFYDTKKRICLILKYDGKQVTNKDSIEYDAKGRISLMTSANFSYGKLQTQVQRKIKYDN